MEATFVYVNSLVYDPFISLYALAFLLHCVQIRPALSLLLKESVRIFRRMFTQKYLEADLLGTESRFVWKTTWLAFGEK